MFTLAEQLRQMGACRWRGGRARGQRLRDGLFVGALALLLTLCGAAGVVAYRTEVRLLAEAAIHRLDVQAVLRATALSNRINGLEEAAATAARDLAEPVEAFEAGEPGAEARLIRQLGQIRGFSGFDGVGLAGADGAPLVPGFPGLPGVMGDVDSQLERNGGVTGLFRQPGGALRFAILMPIREDGAERPIAVLSTLVDMQPFVAPYLSPLGGASRGESILLAEAVPGGFRILELNPDWSGAVSERRVAAGDTRLSRLEPGAHGLLEGVVTDADGRVRLAAAITVPGTGWQIVALADRAAVLADIRGPALAIVGIMLALLTGLSLVWLYALQRQRLWSAVADVERAAEIERAEHLFHDTFEHAAIGLLHVGMDGQILRANRQVGEMLGLEPEELVGQVLSDIIHPDDAATLQASRERLVEQGARVSRIETRSVRRDGRMIWVASTTAFARNGSEPYFIIATEDITERRCTEEALRISEERLQLAVRGARKGMWDYDAKSNAFYASPRWREIVGVAPDTPCDTREEVEALFHPEDRQPARAALQAALDGREAFFDVTIRVIRPAGDIATIEARAFIVRGADGTASRVVGIITDITESLRNARRMSEAAAVFAGTQEGIVITDLRGRIQRVNPAFVRITGYQEEDVAGLNMRILQSGRQGAEFYRVLWESVRHHGFWQG